MVILCASISTVLADADKDAAVNLSRTSRILEQKAPLRIVAFGDSISEVGRSPRWHGGASTPGNNWAWWRVVEEYLAKKYSIGLD